ncbi:MAG: hypothetical protein E7612_10845 [Ruminococcaceae bacterium]|nr:hypothetical protein [Oscillospiraceae bacterium]
MKLRELADALGIESYPEVLEAVYGNFTNDDSLICDVEYIKSLNEKYDFLGDYLDEVLKGAEELKNDEKLLTWARLAYAYCKDASSYEARKFPMPARDGSAARNMFPALVLIREIPDAVKRYEARGFTEAQIKKNLGNIGINLWVHEITVGYPSLSQGLYSWLTLYTKAIIVDHKGFNYQPHSWMHDSMVLKNKKTDERVIVMTGGVFHKDGLFLGSAGITDEEGSFEAEFNEYTDMIFAHPVKCGRVQPNVQKYDKSEWKVVLRKGDDVVSLHIPRNTNLDPDYVSESFKEGCELVKKLYPDLSVKCLICNSWLMEPELAKILGPDAKLSKFTTRFEKHPIKDTTGAGCLGYVWPGEKGPIEERSERTTLQRGIKKLMLEGNFIRGTAGIILEDL